MRLSTLLDYGIWSGLIYSWLYETMRALIQMQMLYIQDIDTNANTNTNTDTNTDTDTERDRDRDTVRVCILNSIIRI